MKTSDPDIHRAINDYIEKLESKGENSMFLDGASPVSDCVQILDDKIYRTAILGFLNCIDRKNNPKWRANEQIIKFLNLGYNEVVLFSKNKKTGQIRRVRLNKKGRMP